MVLMTSHNGYDNNKRLKCYSDNDDIKDNGINANFRKKLCKSRCFSFCALLLFPDTCSYYIYITGVATWGVMSKGAGTLSKIAPSLVCLSLKCNSSPSITKPQNSWHCWSFRKRRKKSWHSTDHALCSLQKTLSQYYCLMWEETFLYDTQHAINSQLVNSEPVKFVIA